MKVATARYLSNVPQGAVIYGSYTQPFGAGVSQEDACERLATIIEFEGPNAFAGVVADSLAHDLTKGLDWPNDGCEISFFLYATEG